MSRPSADAPPPEYRWANSLINRGWHLLKGSTINQIEAAKYFKLAADQNLAEGQFHYGLCLVKGESVAKNLTAAGRLSHGSALPLDSPRIKPPPEAHAAGQKSASTLNQCR
jgi:TPR repeat protein